MIIISSGEPAGIGPDIILKLVAHKLAIPFVVLADCELMRQRARLLGIEVSIKEYSPGNAIDVNHLNVWHIPLVSHCEPGVLNPENSSYVLNMLKCATSACLNKQFTALVTAPVHKGIINQAGIVFSGHTELLAELTATQQAVMMLANDKMRVALATIHLPLAEVPKTLKDLDLVSIINIIHSDLQRRFGIMQPQIYVAGLNPHAGEGGYLGTEEITIIEPALTQCKQQGIKVHGPFPADSLFTAEYLHKADIFLTMYHDQGLPVLKYSGFDTAVNVTLGLPIIRTSVDHGTALSLAGSGSARELSLKMALIVANNMRNCENDYQYHRSAG